MFDNVIFASFVPQILMLLGYLSCLFLSLHLKSEQQPSESLQIIEHTQCNSQSTVSNISFFDSIQVIDEIHSQKQLYLHCFTVLINYFPSLFFETGNDFLFSLFSRPPPTFC